VSVAGYGRVNMREAERFSIEPGRYTRSLGERHGGWIVALLTDQRAAAVALHFSGLLTHH
jgi:hypothetical protein